MKLKHSFEPLALTIVMQTQGKMRKSAPGTRCDSVGSCHPVGARDEFCRKDEVTEPAGTQEWELPYDFLPSADDGSQLRTPIRGILFDVS